MTKIEALELELTARKMVEGTKLDWCDVIKCDEGKFHNSFSQLIRSINSYELALGIIEGKAVWKGDVLFHARYGMVVARAGGTKGYLKVENTSISHKGSEYLASCFSWNPPKPKTVMVELTVDDAEFWNQLGDFWAGKEHYPHDDIYMTKSLLFYAACRKALENMK